MSVDNSSSRSATPGRVKWRRFAMVAVPAAIVAGALIGLTAQGAIASSISVSGEEYLITASKLTGTGFEQYGGQLSGAAGNQPVIISAIHSATLANLCQAVTIGPITLHLTAGTPTPVRLCARGSYGYAFSSHGYLGYRPVSARATFPVWSLANGCSP